MAAATSSAASVGSPRIDQPRPSLRAAASRALLHSAAAGEQLAQVRRGGRRRAGAAAPAELPRRLVADAGRRSSAAPAAQASRTVISFCVSVPVLSVQITVQAPSVSTAESFLISALRRAMRCTPIASASVTVGRSPSGTKATTIPTAKMKPTRERPARRRPTERTKKTHPDATRRAA